MIKSMTGFGKGVSKGNFGSFTVEIRTVNHKYFDLSPRIPNSLSQLEDKIKNYIHLFIKRGKVNFSLSHHKGDKDFGAVKIDYDRMKRYYTLLKKIKNRFKLKDDLSLSHILSFPDVISQEEIECDASLMWPWVEKAVKKAVFDCNRMREREGRAIYRDLIKRAEKMREAIDKIEQMAPEIVSSYKKKLDSRIRQVLKGTESIDRPRLETEVALFAKQSDVSEEVTRSKSHINALTSTLSSTNEAGRRLDFLLQELQREVNTLGSKANSVIVSRLVVDIKSEMEKMREQVQNVE